MFVKICGIRHHDALADAIDAGASAIGFVFAPRSPRCVSIEQAAELRARLAPGVLAVAVTASPSQRAVDDIVARVAPDYLQLDYGALSALDLPASLRVLPVHRAETPAAEDFIVFEGEESGAGIRADWLAAARMAQRSRLILAGGLTVENVADAIFCVRPFGVDVSSGVERARGIKDPDLIRNFIKAARRAAKDLQ